MKTWLQLFGDMPAWLVITGFSAAAARIGFDLAIYLAYYHLIVRVRGIPRV